ncbi:MAG: hypothetical protein HQL46_13620 [Gammaproteobacteria bacterium]|nr:hypothetical protein [Gammaproteobacteria bacterium]
MKRVFLFLVLLLITTLSWATASWKEKGSERMSNEELENFYSNKTMISIHTEYGPLNVFFASNGKAQLGKYEFDGSWWVDNKENNVCIEVNINKKVFCHYTVKNPDGTHTIWHARKNKPLVEIKSALDGNKLYLDLTAKQ